jgi:hypothetical protein
MNDPKTTRVGVELDLDALDTVSGGMNWEGRPESDNVEVVDGTPEADDAGADQGGGEASSDSSSDGGSDGGGD